MKGFACVPFEGCCPGKLDWASCTEGSPHNCLGVNTSLFQLVTNGNGKKIKEVVRYQSRCGHLRPVFTGIAFWLPGLVGGHGHLISGLVSTDGSLVPWARCCQWWIRALIYPGPGHGPSVSSISQRFCKCSWHLLFISPSCQTWVEPSELCLGMTSSVRAIAITPLLSRLLASECISY